jgi:hypothetical protein
MNLTVTVAQETYVIPFQDLYEVSGIIQGCFHNQTETIKQYKLEIEEAFPNDPWVAALKTKDPLTEPMVWLLWKQYRRDPDQKDVPYYFAVKKLVTDETYVIYSDELKMYPINNPTEVRLATAAGIKKGLDPKQLDFKK